MATYAYKGSGRYPQNQENQGYRKYPQSQDNQGGNYYPKQSQNQTSNARTTASRAVSEDLKYRRFLRAQYLNLLTSSHSFVVELLNHFGITLDVITAIRNVQSQTATQKDFNLIRDMGLDPDEINLSDLVLNITLKHYLSAEEATNLLAIVKNVLERKD
jgi:hypothetical protein